MPHQSGKQHSVQLCPAAEQVSESGKACLRKTGSGKTNGEKNISKLAMPAERVCPKHLHTRNLGEGIILVAQHCDTVRTVIQACQTNGPRSFGPSLRPPFILTQRQNNVLWGYLVPLCHAWVKELLSF